MHGELCNVWPPAASYDGYLGPISMWHECRGHMDQSEMRAMM